MTITARESRMLIDGKLVEAASGATFPNVNPATEEAVGDIADAGAEDIDTAIAAARRAFDETSWSEDHSFRRRCLEQLRDALDRAREELRTAVVMETGCPVALTYVVQIEVPLSDIGYWAEQATSYPYEQPMADREWMGTVYRRLIRREAAGVVAAITPWNFPLYLNIAKLGPALAAGNTVVLKPAPDTPWSATMLGKLIADETDIPAGVVNIVTPSDHELGEILTSDPRVDMVTFTGSTATGRRIMAAGSPTLKKMFLELGGKSAYIVLDDADLMAALPTAIGMVCAHAGQGCVIATRLLLPRSRYDQGVEIAKHMMENVPYGDPTDMGNVCGPVVNANQRDRVLGYIDKGIADGARLVVGGGRPAHPDKGFFVEPTLFADVDPDSTIAQEEIFGPVLAIIPYDDDDDAVRIANNSKYGLSGMIQSGSDERAMAVARRVRTGTLSVNGGSWFQPDVPFGGYKQSGIGRENGKEGFEGYLEIKAIGLPNGSLTEMTTSGVALPDDLIAWIEDVAGGRLTYADRRPGGARKEAWFVDVTRADATVDELFLRYDRSDPEQTADPWTLHREATVYLALQETEVPVPRVLGVHPTRQAMLSARVVGENWFSRITDASQRTRTAQHFIAKLAALHRLNPADLDLPAFSRPTTAADAVRTELDELDAVLDRRAGEPDPALVFTLDWLRRNIPTYDGPVVLVQGDTGPGNFMFEDGHVVAIVDWELAHLADPMDDIAWISLRATQEPLPDLPARLREYQHLSGHTIDESRVRYYQVMAEAKLQVMAHRGSRATPPADRDGGGADVGNRMIYGVLHRRLWFEALAAATGLELTAAEVPAGRSRQDHDRLYGAVLDQLRDVIVPRTTDPLARVRAKGVARIVKYLRQVNAYGGFYEQCELDDLTDLLSDRPASLTVGRTSIADAAREHKITDQQYLRYLWRSIARETELARPAMGALADRHWPELH